MSPLMRSECRKFAPNIFNKTKCTNCFRQKEEHSAEALESNRATRKVCKCGYLFVAPDWDFSNPINRTKRWQRRWFVLYDDGELTYSVDEHPDTVPQAVISLLSTAGQGGGGIVWEAPESETGHPHSLAVAAPDRVHFVRGDTRDETRAWLASLLTVASPVPPQGGSRLRQARHKRNATFPGGRSNPMSMGVAQRGTTAVSRQPSPILRQRFNSCISPLHHALPSENDEEDRVGTHHSHSSPVCKASISISSSPTGSSEALLADNTDDVTSTGCHSMLRIRVTGETSVSRSYFVGVDSSSVYCKGIEEADAFLRHTQCHSSPNERLSTVGGIVEKDIKAASMTRSFRSEMVSLGIESSKCSPTNTWRKHSSATDERQSSLRSNSPLEKTVRGDPDGCVLDSMSTSSCCSVEASERVDGVDTEQTAMPAQTNVEIACESRTADNMEMPGARDLSRQLPIKQVSTKHGWLMKLGSSKEWSKHWFVLRGSGLLYYRDPSAEGIGILDGVIDLGLVRDVRDVAVERNHGLQLMTWDGKQCVLSAVTPGIRSGWVAALRKAAGLSSIPQMQSSLPLSDQFNASSVLSGTDNGGLVSLQCITDTSPQVDPPKQSSRELSPILSLPIHMILSSNSNLGITETVQSTLESPHENTYGIGVTLPRVTHKGQLGESVAHVSDSRPDKSKIISSPLCNANASQVEVGVVTSRTRKVGCLPQENTTSNCSNHLLSCSSEFSFDSRELQDNSSTIISTNPLSTSNISIESSKSTLVSFNPPCVNLSYQVPGARSTPHKPPVSPALTPSLPRAAARRHSSSNCIRHTGNLTSDRGTAGVLMLEPNSSDYTRPERPSYLALKALPSSESRESKCAASAGYAPLSYISSSASSCSLSDEDFRTASEASLHSTPISELMVDGNSNSIIWSKGEMVVERGEASNSYLSSDMGSDLGAILPPSPPLNRTPISRVKERARSRVIKRSKTPPEENLQSMKIESLSKRVKELVAALAAKEAELLKEKSKEAASAIKKRSMNGLLESKSKVPALSTGDGGCESIAIVRQNSEEEIGSMTICSQVLTDAARMNEFEEGINNPVVTSMRRLSSSSVNPHNLPRMGSLSDLTNVDLDLDLTSMDRERLIEEWCGLRARFEKAVREIHALRKELRACQGRVDALELESSATSMCLARERKGAEADMSLMANRVQDLTVKLSAAEKQVRQLKQKTSRIESREKRRSLSLRGGRDGRSGTDPSLGTGRLPKEISDRLTHLEACLAAALGHSTEKLAMLASTSPEKPLNKKGIENGSNGNENVPPDRRSRIIGPSSIETIQKGGEDNYVPSTFKSSTKSEKECLQVKAVAKTEGTSKIGNVNLNVGGHNKKSDSKPSGIFREDNNNRFDGCEVNEQAGMEEPCLSAQRNPETWTKIVANCHGSEQRRMRVQGRRQRLNSRLIRRKSEEDEPHGEAGSVAEEEVEELRAEDDSSKGCDPLRILVRLGSLEGRVADFLKTNKDGKKLPLENPTVVEFPASDNNKSQGIGRANDELCPKCEDMRLAMERMKKDLLLVNHGIGCPDEDKTSIQIWDGGSSMVERYREEIEQLRALCEKGMRAMDVSHQRLIKEMEEKHREEVVRVQSEKEQALREETKATLAALDAMRKAHETEVQREVAKFKEEFSRRMSAKHDLSTHHQAEMEGIRREIFSLSQRYSSKCVECASLREQLRIAKGLKDREQVTESEAVVEVFSGHIHSG